MQRTPWTKPKGYLPSDRIPITKSPVNAPKSKGKQHQSSEPPKSTQVRKLESLIQAVRNITPNEKDPKGGCFCIGAF